MAGKKKKSELVTTAESPQTVPAEVVKETEKIFYAAAQVLCGHVNRQFVNSEGKLEDLTCKLTKGHEGDHWSKFVATVTDYGVDENKREIVTGTHTKEKDGWWSDGASTPAKPLEVTQAEDFARLKKSRTRERSSGDVQVDEALSTKIDSEVRGSFGG